VDIFIEIGVIIILAAIFSYLAGISRQPLIPGYVLAGLLVTIFFGEVNTEVIYTLSEIGIAFLLFIVGLELSFKKIKNMGGVSLVTGTVQTIILFCVGFFAMKFLGFAQMESTYLGIVIVFSSTMIVVKLLSDSKELDTLHGRLAIGLLLLQDFFALFALTALNSAKDITLLYILLFLGKGIFVFLIAWLASKYVFPKVFELAAKSQDLLLIISLSICFLFSLLLHAAGYSIAIGAFIGGLTLANLPYNVEIISRVKSLRDFFLILFFTSLGLQLQLSGLLNYWLPIVVLSLIVLLFKPILIMVTTSIYGYSKKTVFEAGVSLAQISEFSLILVAQGVILGQISKDLLSITIIVAIITMVGTSYLVKFEHIIYSHLSKFIPVFGTLIPHKHIQHQRVKHKKNYEIVLCGHDRVGYSVLQTLRDQGRKVLVIDYNPDVIKELFHNHIPCMYGDVSDIEVLERLDLTKIKLIISTANKYEDNEFLLRVIKRISPHVRVFVSASKIDEALDLYKLGADYVILPHFIGGNYVSLILGEMEKDGATIHQERFKHMEELIKRKRLGHNYPMNM
jgi:Kef-type K+ transport system membrane component KefB/Trk K+ transport system NAD-binding subunit